MVPHFYRTSRQDPGAVFELCRWAAIQLPTLQFDNTSAPGPSKLQILSVFHQHEQISHVMNGNKPIFRAQGPLKITNQERNFSKEHCTWQLCLPKLLFPWNRIMTDLSTGVWSGVFVHSAEQLAGMCRFHFWDPADVLTDEWCCYADCLPTKELTEMGRLFLTKPIKEHLMKIIYSPLCALIRCPNVKEELSIWLNWI